MKLLHNDKMALAWAVFIEIGVHALFAAQAFLLGSFLGELALVVIFGAIGAQIGAIALAIFVFGAAFQAFVLGEYMREHVEAFESTAKGNGSYIANWKRLRWLVAAIELSSLLYRCYDVILQGHTIQAIIIFVLGVVLLWYAFAQAKVIHASVNRPVEYDVARMHSETGRSIVQESLRLIPGMSVEQRQRIYNGDLSPVDEQYQSKWQKRNEKLRPKEERQAKERQRQENQREDLNKGRTLKDRLLGPVEPAKNALPFLKAQRESGEPLSQNNGHRN